MKTFKQKMFEVVEKYDHVTFAELNIKLPECCESKEADCGIFLRENLLLWQGWTEEAVYAFRELYQEKKIFLEPVEILVYVIDGYALSLPIAKRIRDYKSLRWLPVAMRPVMKAAGE